MRAGRLAVVLGSLTSVNILLAFVYQWYLVTVLGAGVQMDALVAGMMVPQLVLAIATQSLAHVLVPLLSNLESEEFHDTAWNFFQGIGLGFLVLMVVLHTSAPWWVAWTVPGFSGETLSLTVQLVRIQLLGVVFTAVSSVLWAAHHARDRFRWVEVSAGLSHAAGFALLVWALPRGGVVAAAWIMVLKSALSTVLLLRILGPYRRPRLQSPALAVAWTRLRPLVAGSAYYKTGHFVDRFLASMAPAGGLTLLHLAHQLYSAGTTVLNRGIVSPLIPQLSRAAEAGDWALFRRLWRRRLAAIGIVVAAASIVLVTGGRWTLDLLFGHNRFGTEEVRMLWILLLALTGVWVGGTAGQILSGSFYAMGNTRTPTRVGVAGFTVGIAAKVAGFFMAGVVGIALGTSLYYLINALALYLLLELEMRRHARARAGVSAAAPVAAPTPLGQLP